MLKGREEDSAWEEDSAIVIGGEMLEGRGRGCQTLSS